MKPTIRFSALVEKIGSQTFVILPKNAIAKISLREKSMTEGSINYTSAFRAPLETMSKGNHMIEMNKTLQDAIGVDVGGSVVIELTRIGDETETRVPTDLHKALVAAPRALAQWEDITPLARRDWIFWLIGAKQKETRERRIKKACSMLSSGKRRVCCFAGINWVGK